MSKSRTAHPKPSGSMVKERASRSFASILKWSGAATALLSLVFAIAEVVNYGAETRERRRQIADLEKTADTQQAETDYAAAWTSLEAAQKLATSGGQLSKLLGRENGQARQISTRQENLAMAWIEDVRLTGSQKFSDVVDQIEPVLQAGVTSADGSRKADLLAHIGWGMFLRQRDGVFGQNPEQQYREALKVDPTNPYALANLGHWELWNRPDQLEAAKGYFRAALDSGRARAYVRQLQLAALRDRCFNDEKCKVELLRQLNEMRRNGEPIDAEAKDDLYTIYYFALSDENAAALKILLAAVPPAEQVKTFQAELYDRDFDPAKISVRQASLALLEKAAGDCDESQRTLSSVGSDLSPTIKAFVVGQGAAFRCAPAQH